MFRKAVLLLTIALSCAVHGESQPKQRALSGVVTDKAGNTLPGVAVQIENTFDLKVRSYITAKDGRYHFDALSDDVEYVVRAKYKNWWSQPKTLSKFDSSTHPEVNLVIPVD
jgi:hypothetical protein